MYQIVKKYSVIFFSVIMIVSCSKNKSGNEILVPSDAKMVLTINANQLMSKLASGGINVDNFLNLQNILLDTTNKPVAKFWTNSTMTGLDYNQPFVFAISPSNDVRDKFMTVRLIAAISNKDSFETFLKANKIEIEKGDINYSKNSEMSFGYTNKNMVYIAQVPANKFFNNASDTTTILPKEMSFDVKKELIKTTLNLKNSKSILSNKDYAKQNLGNNDMKLWIDQEYVLDNYKSENKVQLVTRLFLNAFKGSSNSTLLNFENGKIVTNNQVYFNEDISKTIKQSAAQTIDLTMLNGFTGKDLNVIAGISLSPSMILDLIKYLKEDGIMNVALSQMNLNANDVFNTITGDIIVVGSDINSSSNSQDFKNRNFGILVKLKDKSNLDKLLTLPTIAKGIKKDNGNLVINTGNNPNDNYYVSFKNNIAIISPNKKLINDYISNTGSNTFDQSALDKLKGKSMGFYVNMSSLNFQKGLNSGSVLGIVNNTMSNLFTNLNISSGSFKENYIETIGTINLQKTDVNSLVYLVKNGYKISQAPSSNLAKSSTNKLEDANNDDDRIEPMKVK